MPVRYIGRKGTYKGDFLFHLLCNLRGFGVGRMVVRQSWLENYPEPTYFIIKKASPDLTHDGLRAGKIIAKHVFRGNLISEEKVVASGYSPDWELVPKDEERKYLDNDKVYTPPQLPIVTDMPPLLSLLYTDKLKNAGREVRPEDTQLMLRVVRTEHNLAKQPLYDRVEQSLSEEEKQQFIEMKEVKRQKKKEGKFELFR